jgi:hypothetical protein
VIGVGELGLGQPGQSQDARQVMCHFEFEITGLPEVDSYGVQMQHRGTLRYTLADLRAKNWSVRFSLSSH